MKMLRSTESMRWRSLRTAAMVLVAIVVMSCQDEESAARERIAGDYAREFGSATWKVRDVLTLRRDGTWIRIRKTYPSVRPIDPDSGTYRILGETINLRSLALGGGPTRYTVLGDTLFGANAAEMQRFTGVDMGEERLFRMR